MITTYIHASTRGFTFAEIVEIISNAMIFLNPADAGPWLYK